MSVCYKNFHDTPPPALLLYLLKTTLKLKLLKLPSTQNIKGTFSQQAHNMYYILLSIFLKQDCHMDGAVSPGIHFQALEGKNDHEKSAWIHKEKLCLTNMASYKQANKLSSVMDEGESIEQCPPGVQQGL